MVVVDVESGIDINEDNCLKNVQNNWGLNSPRSDFKNNKNGKYPKMVGHPYWRESKQALLIICKESPMQSAFRQTLHSSNDNLNFLLDILTAFKSDRDTVYLIQTQSCEKLLTKNYWIHWIDLGEHKSIIFLQWTNYLVSNCLVLNLDGISDFKVSCCKTYSAYDMQHKWCIEIF